MENILNINNKRECIYMYIPVLSKEDEKFLRKRNAKKSANLIVEQLTGLDIADVLTELYIRVDDEESKALVKLYESELILALTDKNKFIAEIHNFYTKATKYIKKNKLYNHFLLFFYQMYKQSFHENVANQDKVAIAYMTLLIEQMSYLSPVYNELLVGTNTNGKPIFMKDPYPYIDYPEYICTKKKIRSLDELFKMFKKVGYNISSEFDIDVLFMNYRIITNMIINTSFLIDEYNVDMIPKKFPYMVDGFDIPISNNEPTHLEELMKNRRRLLKGNRVITELNFGEIKEIEIREKFVNDELFLLIKFTFKDGTGINGFYDIMNNIFYSPCTNSTNRQAKLYENKLKEIVYEIYLIQTADLDIEKTHYKDYNMKFIYKGDDLINENKTRRKYIKNGEYVEEIINLSAYTRKLPMGAKASDNAIQEAKKYGINLNNDETFVKPFQKNIYKLKK